jgi:hypothetical protein
MNALPREAIGADRVGAVEEYLTGLQDRICTASAVEHHERPAP